MTRHPRPPSDQSNEPDADGGVYVISVAAELLGVHPQTLRGYERHGLLNPTRTPGGTRLYSDADLDRAGRVIELSNEGLTLTGIARVLTLEDRIARLRRPSTALVPFDPKQASARHRTNRPSSTRPTGDGRRRTTRYRGVF